VKTSESPAPTIAAADHGENALGHLNSFVEIIFLAMAASPALCYLPANWQSVVGRGAA